MSKIDEMLKEVLQYAMEKDDIGFVIGDKIATRITEIRDQFSKDFRKLISDIESVNKSKLLGPVIEKYLNDYLLIILPYLNSNMMIHDNDHSYDLSSIEEQAKWNLHSVKYSCMFLDKIKVIETLSGEERAKGLEDLSKSINSVIKTTNIERDTKQGLKVLHTMVKSMIPLMDFSK